MERLDVFMARANATYYATHDPFADFTTAPEISQVFGELLGAWSAVVWEMMGRPDPVVLAEAGPGRGTLMADALRAVGRVAAPFRSALALHLIETSPRLRALQAACLPDASWHDALETVPRLPLLLIANEFLDALPIRQFVRSGADWAERYVADGRFVDLPCPRPRSARSGEDSFRQCCEAAEAWVTDVAGRLVRNGGAMLVLDYGGETCGTADTLQALRNGRAADPLARPGEADLTAHVDFAALAEAARREGATVAGPVPQGHFLASLGLFQRTDRIARMLAPGQALALHDAARRLAAPDRMGHLFKAFAICHPSLPMLPGFAA